MAFKKIKVWVSDLTSKVVNLGSDTFGNPFFLKGLKKLANLTK